MRCITGYDKAHFKQIQRNFIERYGIEKWKKLEKKLAKNPYYKPFLSEEIAHWWMTETQLKERIEFMNTKLGKDVYYTLIHPELHKSLFSGYLNNRDK